MFWFEQDKISPKQILIIAFKNISLDPYIVNRYGYIQDLRKLYKINKNIQ